MAETGIIRSFKMHHDGVWTVSQDKKEQKHDLGQISEINTFEEVSESCSVMSNSLQPHGLYSAWNSPGQNTGVDSLSLLQGIFPTQGLKPGLLPCRRILYQLSHNGSPKKSKVITEYS